MNQRTGGSTAKRVTVTVTLLGVLAAAVSYSARAGDLVARRRRRSRAKPANPTSSQSASFTYTDSQAITKFQCQLDGAGFTDCGTAKALDEVVPGPLAAGSHTFQVRAVYGHQDELGHARTSG